MSRWEQREEEEGLLLGLLCSPLSFLHLKFSKSVLDPKLFLLLLFLKESKSRRMRYLIDHRRRISAVLAYCADFLDQDFWSWFVDSYGWFLEVERMYGSQHHPQAQISKVRTSNLQGNRSDLLYFTYIRCSIETCWYDQHVVLALYILIFDLISCNNHIIRS